MTRARRVWGEVILMRIDERARALLELAKQYCDDEDKSTEFMIEYMQDMTGEDFDTVMAFLEEEK